MTTSCPSDNPLNNDNNTLSLLLEWIGLNEQEVSNTVRLGHAGNSKTRGLLTNRRVEERETLFTLPWKFVLGMSASFRLLQSEQDEGGRSLVENVNRIPCMLASTGIVQDGAVWSCVMACALLTAVRYPPSAWGSYVACLPSSKSERIDLALRTCHAYQVKRSIKRRARTALPKKTQKLSKETLKQANAAYKRAIARERDSMNDLLLWDPNEIHELHDDELTRVMVLDFKWLRLAWETFFCVRPEADDSNEEETIDQEPLVSWSSWLWAHAILRSRAVEMPDAPKSVTSETIQSLQYNGVLLPVIDFINHGGAQHCNAKLTLTPQGVSVVATKPLSADDEILFNYDPNATMRSILRGYGFVDVASKPLRQSFTISRVEIDATSTCGLPSRDKDTNGREEEPAPLMRVVSIKPRLEGGGIRIELRNDGHLVGECCLTKQDGLFNEEVGKICNVAANCCKMILAEIKIHHHNCAKENGELTTSTNKDHQQVAKAYQRANIKLLEWCIHDLSSLAKLFDHTCRYF